MAALMGGLVAGLIAAFAIPFVRDFFLVVPPDFAEVLVILAAFVLAVGLLGVAGYRVPYFVRVIIDRVTTETH